MGLITLPLSYVHVHNIAEFEIDPNMTPGNTQWFYDCEFFQCQDMINSKLEIVSWVTGPALWLVQDETVRVGVASHWSVHHWLICYWVIVKLLWTWIMFKEISSYISSWGKFSYSFSWFYLYPWLLKWTFSILGSLRLSGHCSKVGDQCVGMLSLNWCIEVCAQLL